MSWNEIKKRLPELKSLDYRHYICIAVTLGFLAFSFLFCNALPRLAETVRDLFISCAYYVCGLFMDSSNPIQATVNGVQEWEFAPSPFPPLELFPYTWEEFQALWSKYWEIWATGENLRAYCYFLGDCMYYLSKFLLILMPLVLFVIIYARKYTDTYNNDYDADSHQLIAWKSFVSRTVYPVRDWICGFRDFLSEHDKYLKLWAFLWLLYFNFISVLVAFLAYYLYFIVSFDLLSLYTQLTKLLYDLTPVIRFLPGIVWAIIGICIFNYICKQQAYSYLYHCENKNRGFINERGVVTIVYGPMGVGKTSLLTSMSLSSEVELRDSAFEILLENDLKFPNFPWCNLREEMKRRIEAHELVDVPSVRRWISGCRNVFAAALEDPMWWKRQMRKRRNRAHTFGYDFERYEITYNDELKIIELYDAIEDYACAYFVYTVETSLIISNYSVRTDAMMEDLGNFPLWDSDFFKRDPRLMDAYSRHAHIIDFDMLRLGNRMVEENPNRNAFGFGVYLVSEIDKERKNALELKETKINVDNCNQKNDLFNSCLKMSRHACVIANRVFLKIICDLQRPEDWGAGGREVGEVVYIAENGELAPALPFYSPFWLTEGIFNFVKAKFYSFYTTYIHNRSDNTLFVYLLKGIVSKLDNHYRKINNLFGCQTLHLEVENGRMNGDSKKKKYYRMPKKDYSKRYSTNCLSAIFEGDELNTVSINDLREYADIMATSEELALQNSHFQTDIRKMKEKQQR